MEASHQEIRFYKNHAHKETFDWPYALEIPHDLQQNAFTLLLFHKRQLPLACRLINTQLQVLF